MSNANNTRRISLAAAKAQYPHRYTAEHVPAWAKEPLSLGRFYAPQYASDAEWYENTAFPGEANCYAADHCVSNWQTWPHGKWLGAVFVPGQPVTPWRDPREMSDDELLAELQPGPKVGDVLNLGADYLQRESLHFFDDSQEVAAVCDALGMDDADVTGVVVEVGEGDYREVWTTDSSRPWAVVAPYTCRRVEAKP